MIYDKAKLRKSTEYSSEITIPKDILNKSKLEHGDTLIFKVVNEKTITMEKLEKQ
jgi:bifunctional DNA-binding transcriptional regulator/antitoxin component of YhaV-PrlF toxin-antitoxin module